MDHTLPERKALERRLASLDKRIGKLTVERYDIAGRLLALDAEARKAEERKALADHYAAMAAEAARTEWAALDGEAAS